MRLPGRVRKGVVPAGRKPGNRPPEQLEAPAVKRPRLSDIGAGGGMAGHAFRFREHFPGYRAVTFRRLRAARQDEPRAATVRRGRCPPVSPVSPLREHRPPVWRT
ncbi:protein of unknown function [Candidatus Hydrogenisulfobacillus filiaventi]|uniref:Uncharacterized protein n=1 Tax=Candidatus Hydrogenisulfobacillus filiaventi TaxID=2707344 RepID=A0A6F8ZF93_9FIRM|nr:protein of unknown function [Candidatus Hydrogenisulfobacillus filiaventi]